jgi:hypothetical protein
LLFILVADTCLPGTAADCRVADHPVFVKEQRAMKNVARYEINSKKKNSGTSIPIKTKTFNKDYGYFSGYPFAIMYSNPIISGRKLLKIETDSLIRLTNLPIFICAGAVESFNIKRKNIRLDNLRVA